jgi:SAM-dependent methyltransferase
MLKGELNIIERSQLYYVEEQGRPRRFKPWLGDAFSFLYDVIMRTSIFPKKFGADMGRHYHILEQALKDIHGKRVLELATGSGSAVNYLQHDNHYTGTDISPGLLRKAVRKFRDHGFVKAGFYVSAADDLPFEDSAFDLCLCVLSLNFFDNIHHVFREIRRILVPGGVFVCSVPVPERNERQNTINGTLHSEDELAAICRDHGFAFKSIPQENGALLYFTAALVSPAIRSTSFAIATRP